MRTQMTTAGGLVASLALVLGTMGPAQAATVTINATSGTESYDLTSRSMPDQFHAEWGYQLAYSTHNAGPGTHANGLVWTSSAYHDWTTGAPIASSSTINAFDANTGNWVKSIKTPVLGTVSGVTEVAAAFGLAVQDDGTTHNLWASSTRHDQVIVYKQAANGDTHIGGTADDNQVVAVIDGVAHPRDIVIDTYRDKAYVSSPKDGSNIGRIYEIDTNTYAITKIWVGGTAGAGETSLGFGENTQPMSLDANFTSTSARIFTVGLNTGRVFSINTLTGAVTTISWSNPAGGSSGVAFNPAGTGTLYVAQQGGKRLYTYKNVTTGTVAASYITYGADQLNVAVDKDDSITTEDRVYTTGFGGNRIPIAKPDGTSIGTLATANTYSYEVGTKPNDVLVANGKVWVVDRNETDNKLWILEP